MVKLVTIRESQGVFPNFISFTAIDGRHAPDLKELFELITGSELRDAFISGANNIAKQKTSVDELNIFPVPDGDTGTNMSMTMLAAAKELGKSRGKYRRKHSRHCGLCTSSGSARQFRRYFISAFPGFFKRTCRFRRSQWNRYCKCAGHWRGSIL